MYSPRVHFVVVIVEWMSSWKWTSGGGLHLCRSCPRRTWLLFLNVDYCERPAHWGRRCSHCFFSWWRCKGLPRWCYSCRTTWSKIEKKKIQFQIYFWAVVSTIFLNVKVFDEFFFFLHYILRIYTYCVGLGSSLMLLKASKAALILAWVFSNFLMLLSISEPRLSESSEFSHFCKLEATGNVWDLCRRLVKMDSAWQML